MLLQSVLEDGMVRVQWARDPLLTLLAALLTVGATPYTARHHRETAAPALVGHHVGAAHDAWSWRIHGGTAWGWVD